VNVVPTDAIGEAGAALADVGFFDGTAGLDLRLEPPFGAEVGAVETTLGTGFSAVLSYSEDVLVPFEHGTDPARTTCQVFPVIWMSVAGYEEFQVGRPGIPK
jgi:hypothetical protein